MQVEHVGGMFVQGSQRRVRRVVQCDGLAIRTLACRVTPGIILPRWSKVVNSERSLGHGKKKYHGINIMYSDIMVVSNDIVFVALLKVLMHIDNDINLLGQVLENIILYTL
ncbi:hypothetical protein HW555_002161 [Spodoptera exigua]|uniref:Uncharacterized protein n=1 Tax=Spodoptera exigua TaxID=7107 RepID=A0A835GNT7_SPOEX|nr:hypothetical protein HW555_002161 [Spodoptera exigua]